MARYIPLIIIYIALSVRSLEAQNSSFTTVNMPGSATWFDTDIQLQAGQTFRITAYGTIHMWPRCVPVFCPLYQTSPDGFSNDARAYDGVPRNTKYPAPDARLGILVGRIGDGDPFVIGEGGTFLAGLDGPLQLEINDGKRSDNRGSFTVEVVVEPL